MLISPSGFKGPGKIFKLLILLSPLFCTSQVDSTITLTFDFNEHKIKEKEDKILPRHLGARLTYDRFGNEESAVQLDGYLHSYLNLGVSKLLKSPVMTISLWVKIHTRVYAGKGYPCNPILLTKNGPGDDFNNALCFAYDFHSQRLGCASTKDSLEEVGISGNENVTFNKWYHLALVCNNSSMSFYIDGELIARAKKNFETKFMASDSMMIGHTANKKNVRFLWGVVDDIHFFHRSLSDQEIKALYNAPNPNEFRQTLKDALKYIYIITGFVAILVLILIRNKRVLRKQKEQLELNNKMSQMELKAIKAQMNPHFISNCLVAIQDLVYDKNIDNAALYLARFSFFLRQVLNYSDENYISLARELEMIKLYVELEQLRFTDKFRFEINVPEAIDREEIMVPSLITQPFIENAIWHGLLPLKGEREARLNVNVFSDGGEITIEIADNGVGRNLNIATERKSKGTRLALDKIDSLNRLAGNNSYKIEIIDLMNGDTKCGTKILIHLDL